ncbi:TetR/AcrR family transcriptional regulator [Ralstonia solanacearum]|uniref:TetR/AcrR family transcriptional regulator n=1 Tax=Ralstonia solanacearum TaxID=305 RepID=A0AAE3T3X5_RALSL|nr:TetR/AcrR family transcriptional regulator [Ralstonia solanacearum]MBB6585013.1 TetR/AcrR family transcriptional regulator [Ralstonia solanacearum]MDB0520634.1 TetR/AcrR family transcriptional regulator [Ralstonia solanacearum]
MAARGPRALSSTDNTGTTTSRRISGEAAQASLLEAARELFYYEGVRAVGVEAVVERAGVNKMSLYRQFKSKDDLVLAYLARSDENFWGYFNASMGAHPGDARAQLLQFFIDLSGRAGAAGYRGCPFVNVAAEFPDPSHPARQFVERNKSQLLARLRERAAAAGATDPDALADDLAFLIEGAYAASQTFGAGAPRLLRSLPRTAAALLDGAIPARQVG